MQAMVQPLAMALLMNATLVMLCNLVTAQSAANGERCPGNSVNLYTPKGVAVLVYRVTHRGTANLRCDLATARSGAKGGRCPGDFVNLYTPEGRCGLVTQVVAGGRCRGVRPSVHPRPVRDSRDGHPAGRPDASTSTRLKPQHSTWRCV